MVNRRNRNTVKGSERSFEDLHIVNLRCGEFCFVQDVNLPLWMRQAVYLSGNHTVQGETILESPDVLMNLR